MKQRWVIFGDWGGEVVKGFEPQDEVYIKAPEKLPYEIPMHYWKLNNGKIEEMNEEEKKKSDELCKSVNSIYVPPQNIPKIDASQMNIVTSNVKPEPLIINNFNEDNYYMKDEIDNRIEPLASHDFVIGKVHQIVDELNKRDEQLKNLALVVQQQVPRLIQDGLEQVKNSSPSYKDLEKVSNVILDKMEPSKKEIESLKKEVKDLKEVDRTPKIEKFYIINDFAKKEYIQIALVSGGVYLLMQFLSYLIK